MSDSDAKVATLVPPATALVVAAVARSTGVALLPVGQSGPKKYLSFTLKGEVYAISIDQIKEIISFRPITTVPMMPSYLRGIINLRGIVVPVIDLACRFGLESTPIGKRTCIVILEISLQLDTPDQRHILGLMVDMVNAVVDITPQAIEPPPAFGTNIRPDFLQGMTRIKEKFMVLLNMQRIVLLEELQALRSMPQP